ncbi:MAG: hypothetical protein M3P18_23100 [Actinomycetota bacterium]|nr:hypothetical protein [Actinomycetota bacterium]
MPGRATAVHSGAELRDKVVELGRKLGLDARTEVRVARRLWGAVRCIDVVLTRPETGKTLGVECKYQGGGGSAEEKVPATIQDIAAWPIPGIVVFGGEGFSPNMVAYFHSTGKAVALNELEPWLRLFFGLASQT